MPTGAHPAIAGRALVNRAAIASRPSGFDPIAQEQYGERHGASTLLLRYSVAAPRWERCGSLTTKPGGLYTLPDLDAPPGSSNPPPAPTRAIATSRSSSSRSIKAGQCFSRSSSLQNLLHQSLLLILFCAIPSIDVAAAENTLQGAMIN
jgi:hypothetical protein